jgi:ribosomal protein L18
MELNGIKPAAGAKHAKRRVKALADAAREAGLQF